MLASNQAALVPILVASIVVPLAVLAGVLRLMWRSSKRHGSDGAPEGHSTQLLRWTRVSRGAWTWRGFWVMAVALGPGGRRVGNDDSSL